MSRGGDSQDALRRVWMEGYERGKKDAAPPPIVEIDPADLRRVYEPGSCANPECPCGQAHVSRLKGGR